MKKVVILSPANPYRGGIASSSERLAIELQKEGYEVEIHTFRLQYPNLLFPGKTQYTDDPPPAELSIKRTIHSMNPFNWWRLGNRLKKERPDLIVTRFWIPFIGPSLGTIARIAARNGVTKAICISDNIIPHEKRPFDKLLTRYFVRSMHGFVVMSKSVGEDLRQFSNQVPFRFVPHPIYDNYGVPVSREEALAHLGLPMDQRYLLFFGFIRDYKGLDLLLRAFADERLKAFPLRLIIAGEFYGNEEKYQRLIDELGVRDKVDLFTQYIPHEEVRFYFGAADLVVQTYRSATQSGISQLAYHFEKPMVVTNVGGLPEIVDHNQGGYVVPVEVQAIADAILDFFAQDRAESMKLGVRQKKDTFSWANLVRALEALNKEAR
jgi:D-inositol-3-phosphate glycosyltransferase